MIKAEYVLPQSGQDQESIYDYLVSRYTSGQVFSQRGSVTSGQASASAKLEQTYYTPYLAHAAIEPHAAVASMEGTRFTVWASTQTPFTTRSDTGAARLITPYVGGGFGGKAAHQQAIEAAQIARAIGKPVSVAWTREEDSSTTPFSRPPSSRSIQASTRTAVWSSGIRRSIASEIEGRTFLL